MGWEDKIQLYSLFETHFFIIFKVSDDDLFFCKTVIFLKYINHGRKIEKLPHPLELEQWFHNVMQLCRLQDLCRTNYSTINHVMMSTFVERWYYDTSSFHFPHGEMSITLDGVSCLVHLPIMGRLLNHDRIIKNEALVMIMTYSGADPGDALKEIEDTRGCHVRSGFLERLYA